MKIFLVVFFAFIPWPGIAQHKTIKHKPAKKAIACKEEEYPDPFKGKPFSPGKPRVMVLDIPIGKIQAKFRITYILESMDGNLFSFGQLYRANIEEIKPLGPQTDTAFSNSFMRDASDRMLQLTEGEVKAKYIRTKGMAYWFDVDDYNMDGRPDFAYTIDYFFHGSPLGHSVFVNLRNRLYQWQRFTGKAGNIEDPKKRILSLYSPGQTPAYFKVIGDTMLVPLPDYDPDAVSK